jgi:serine protease Do
LDAAVNFGNSGGPVYNDRGEVIGITTAKYTGLSSEGLGFAIPINDAVRIAEDLITNGYVTGKAYMGVWLDDRYNAIMAQYYNMPLGAYVSEVEEGSAAAKAGLEAGDIITRVGDTDVASAADLRTAIRQFTAGDKAVLTVYRAGESKTLTIVFDEKTPQSGAPKDEG